MGQSTWECLRILSSIMKVLALILLVSAVSAKNIKIQLLAPPTELEHGYCKGSPEPADLDKLSIDPFPIMIGNGLTETLELQVTLKEEIAKELRFIWTQSWKASFPSLVWRSMDSTLDLVTTMLTIF